MTPQEVVDALVMAKHFTVIEHDTHFEVVADELVVRISPLGGIAQNGPEPVELTAVECNRILNEISRRVDKME